MPRKNKEVVNWKRDIRTRSNAQLDTRYLKPKEQSSPINPLFSHVLFLFSPPFFSRASHQWRLLDYLAWAYLSHSLLIRRGNYMVWSTRFHKRPLCQTIGCSHQTNHARRTRYTCWFEKQTLIKHMHTIHVNIRKLSPPLRYLILTCVRPLISNYC